MIPYLCSYKKAQKYGVNIKNPSRNIIQKALKFSKLSIPEHIDKYISLKSKPKGTKNNRLYKYDSFHQKKWLFIFLLYIILALLFGIFNRYKPSVYEHYNKSDMYLNHQVRNLNTDFVVVVTDLPIDATLISDQQYQADRLSQNIKQMFDNYNLPVTKVDLVYNLKSYYNQVNKVVKYQKKLAIALYNNKNSSNPKLKTTEAKLEELGKLVKNSQDK